MSVINAVSSKKLAFCMERMKGADNQSRRAYYHKAIGPEIGSKMGALKTTAEFRILAPSPTSFVAVGKSVNPSKVSV